MAIELKVIMFTDQVNSTGNMRQRTHIEIGIVTSEQNNITTVAVSRCQGENPKDNGDGHMIQFRACSTAVRCGHLIQWYVKQRNEAQNNDKLKFGLHVGIDFGEALVLDNKDLRANAANMAARVSTKSPEGDVYFTEKVAQELNPRDARFELVGRLPLKGIKGKVRIYRLIEWLSPIDPAPNPFTQRDGITKAEDFFGREYELRRLRDLLHRRQNCQIIGPQRIGKTSLLRQVESQAAEWDATAVVAYVDQQDGICQTRKGWLEYVSKKWRWDAVVISLAEFSKQIDNMLTHNLHPVLCLDEFEEMRAHPKEFTHDFFMALKACGEKGLAIITSSQKSLYKLLAPQAGSSPFFKAFTHLSLKAITRQGAIDFVNAYRPGVPPFTSEEKKRILRFSKCHPLALQVACDYVLQAKDRESIPAALRKAAAELRDTLPDGW